MSHQAPALPMKGALALKVFIFFAFAYVLSYAFRSVNAVIAPELMADLKISNSQLGFLSAAYFIGFSAMQIPLGIALDKFGVRRVESILLLMALAGTLIFAFSESLFGLTVGRLLIGIGVSACLMAAFTAYRRWFALEQQGQLASAMLVFGTVGALMTTVPVQFSLPYIGWRGVFLVMAILVLIGFIGIRFGLPTFDDHPHVNNPPLTDDHQPIGLKDVFLNPFFLRMLGYAFNAWFIPRANRQGFQTLTYMKYLLSIGLVAQLIAMTWQIQLSWILWIVLAISATGHILGQSTVITAFPSRNAGLASTSYNLLIFVGAFIFQWSIGWGIDLMSAQGFTKPEAFRQVFLIFLVLQVISFIWFLYYPKPLKHHLAAK
jgi:MFS family permease